MVWLTDAGHTVLVFCSLVGDRIEHIVAAQLDMHVAALQLSCTMFATAPASAIRCCAQPQSRVPAKLQPNAVPQKRPPTTTADHAAALPVHARHWIAL